MPHPAKVAVAAVAVAARARAEDRTSIESIKLAKWVK
jgi:hypothetical protein